MKIRAAYTVYPTTESLMIETVGTLNDLRGGRDGRRWWIVVKSASATWSVASVEVCSLSSGAIPLGEWIRDHNVDEM